MRGLSLNLKKDSEVFVKKDWNELDLNTADQYLSILPQIPFKKLDKNDWNDPALCGMN